jgi:uncharacterized protein
MPEENDMKKLIIIILVIVFAAVGFGFIATTVAKATSEEEALGIGVDGTVLTVYGSGSIKLEPDVAYINLGVITQQRDLKTAQDNNSASLASVLTAIKGVGIKEDDIKTSGYNIYPQYDRNSSPAKIEGYEIRNELSITIKDIDSVGLVLDAATKAGANSAGSISFGSLKEEEAYSEALGLAFKSAKSKADALAAAAGMKVKTTISIFEGLNTSPAPLSRAATLYAADEMSSVPIEAGLLTISADVTVVYAIK